MATTSITDLSFADSVYRQGRFAEAEAAYAEVVRVNPGNLRAAFRLGEIAFYGNRLAEAERCFTFVMEHGSRLQRFWPFSLRLNLAMAMLRYRQDRLAEAGQLFGQSAGPVPWGPFSELRNLARHMALFREEPAYFIEGPPVSRVEFVTTDPLPVVEVSVCGGKPVRFFIDTGAAEVVVGEHLARQARADITGKITGQSAGPKGRVGLGRIDSMQIGDFVLRNVPIHTLDTGRFAPVFGDLEVQGAIGTRLLMHLLETLDYVRGSLTLRRSGPPAPEFIGSTVGATEVKVVPFWLIQMHYIVALGTVNGGMPVLFLVDTGLAGKGFTAPESFLREAGIPVDWTKAQQGIGGFGSVKEVDIVADEVTLGTAADELVVRAVPGVAVDKPLPILGYRLGFLVGGLVSHRFFRECALTLDFVQMRLIVARNDEPHSKTAGGETIARRENTGRPTTA